MKRSVLISLLVLLAVFCLCLCALAAVTGGYLVLDPPTFREPSASSEEDAPVSGEPTSVLSPLPTSTPSPHLPDDVARQMDEIESQVVELRRLQPETTVNRFMLTREDLYQKVVEEFFVDYTREDAQQDVFILSLLGLLEPGYDLYQLYIDLYSEQVAGYYDDQTKEMYVVQAEGFFGTERMTYAHEYVHALQDQVYDLENVLMLNTEYCETNTEYCAATTALIEGDAVFSEQLWFLRYATEEDYQEVQEFYQSYTSPVYDSTPEYLKQDFLFPYQQGLEFVQSIYDHGGWAAVDEVYLNPPQSTEQILHPDKYPHDVPEKVALPDLQPVLGEGWEEIDDNVMGEWYTFLILAYGSDPAYRLPFATARQASSGWKGDAYAVYQVQDTTEAVLVFRTRWETTVDADEYWDALTSYGEARWGNPDDRQSSSLRWQSAAEGIIAMVRLDQDVIWVVAPDEAVLKTVLAAVQTE